MKLLNQAKKLPLSSGVYFFLNKKGNVLYVGKATFLRKRVLSYFQKNLDPRIKEMLDFSRRIKYKKTDSVLEAIILEANLIKKYWPKYNVKEKDNRSFIYIVIPKGDYPRPYLARYRELQKFLPDANVFGPYQSLSLIKNGLRIIRRIFPYSTCLPAEALAKAGKIGAGPEPSRQGGSYGASKPCFDYQIGLCPGACAGKISKDDYKKNIANIILFLKGEKRKLLKKLKKENPKAIQSLKHIQDVALISREEASLVFFLKIEGYDISHLTGKETVGSMVVFTNGTADNSQYRLFKIREAPANDDLRALEEVITRRFKHLEWPTPNLILIDGGKPQIDYISKVLKKRNIAIPLVGISKFAGDKLVFPPKIKSSLKELIQSMKNTLLKVREEAHRFALKSSRRQRKIMLK